MKIGSIFTIASSMAIYSDVPNFTYGVPYRDELRNIDISDEYELVIRKKSKLSARLRRMVVARYQSLHNNRIHERSQ